MTAPLYPLFFLSGAASLVYQVAWVRSLALVFGGSHLAVTTVVSVFMGGLALGGLSFGRAADRTARPLRLYGFLEIGIAAFGALFLLLMQLYPSLYPPLARLSEGGPLRLAAVRILFAGLAMLGPTTLMGGTLPVLAASARPGRVAADLSFLYAVNTLGAVAGSLACGFLLLRTIGVGRTQAVAIGMNLAVGAAALLLSARAAAPAGGPPHSPAGDPGGAARPGDAFIPRRLVLWGTALAGSCALGSEVLWTRLLGMVVGTSTYSFSVILVAFLGGMAAGSQVLGWLQRWWPRAARARVAAFGLTLLATGLASGAVTALMRDLPARATELQAALLRIVGVEFAARQGASLGVALAYVLVPTFLMGAAFPMAGALVASARAPVGRSVGDALLWNTVGSILGAALAGFLLVPLLGLERSLHLLALLDAGAGILLVAAGLPRPALRVAAGAGVAGLALVFWLRPGWMSAWDQKLFAVFMNNNREAFATPGRRAETLALFEVLFFHEGANETISVIRRRDSQQSLVVNGRPEASTAPWDVQLQLALGHLPMLLHPAPRRVFVLGAGAGMTLGAVSIHPELERLTLAEIEPGVLPATRTFSAHNHRVLDHPRLRIVFNDGRNHLLTTDETYDVITADPIHPWSGGAAYLYTSEYFALVRSRLRPGGVVSQWLPLYELSPADVRSVVRTFSTHFAHSFLWVTYGDAVLVGSDDPIFLDEGELDRRIGRPGIRADLERAGMGSSEDLLGYLLLGPEAVRRYSAGARINTDDNLFLEFSAPVSMGNGQLLGQNVVEIARARESILPYLAPAAGGEARLRQAERWQRLHRAGRAYDFAHALSLWRQEGAPQYRVAAEKLGREFPDYAPWRFLARLGLQP